MWIKTVNLKHTVAALGLYLLLPGMGGADIPAPELMQRLHDANESEAPRIAREVETVWGRSGSAAMDLLLKRGREALEDGNFPLAIEHLTALVDHAPDFAEGYHMRAQAYYRANLYGPAIEDLEHVLALNPDNFKAIFGLAVMLQEFGELRRAALLYRKVLAIYPTHENAQAALVRLQRDGIGREL